LTFQTSLLLNYLNKIKKYLNIKKRKNKKKFSLYFFSNFINKKQMYFRFLTKKKMYSFSMGQLLKKKIEKIKFFKKSIQNLNYSIGCLNRKFRKPISSIYLLYCKNFNFKNYLWLKKFFLLNKPQTEYIIFTHSWNYITKKKRRIKRKIFKRLLKQSKL